MTTVSNAFGNASPKSFSSPIFLDDVNVPGMDLESAQAIAERLSALRYMVNETQTAFAVRLGIDLKRWNNLERGYNLTPEVARLIVRRFPFVTWDWLFRGNEAGLTVRARDDLQQALEGLRRQRATKAQPKTPQRGS